MAGLFRSSERTTAPLCGDEAGELKLFSVSVMTHDRGISKMLTISGIIQLCEGIVSLIGLEWMSRHERDHSEER